MGFQKELREIEELVLGKTVISEDIDDEPILSESDIDITEEDWGEDWTPATSIAYFATVIEMLDEEMGNEKEVDELLAMILEAAYKWSHAVDQQDKDLTPDVGTIDEPSAGYKMRGFRGTPSGMTPAMERGIMLLVKQAAENPPKFVYDAKLENSVEVWKEAAGKAINKGIGWSVKTDKKTGMTYPVPSYGTIKKIWAAMIAKSTGFAPTAAADKTIDRDIEIHRKKAAKELAKGVAKIGKKQAGRASTIMRGARGKGKKEAK